MKLDIVALTAEVLKEMLSGKELTCEAVHGFQSLEAVVAAHASHNRKNVPVEVPVQDMETMRLELPIT